MRAINGLSVLGFSCFTLVACNPTPPGGGVKSATQGIAPTTAPAATADSAASNNGAAVAPANATTTIYEVSAMRGAILGSIEIPPGKLGTLTLTATGDDADRLKELWANVEKTGTATAKMHVGGGDGKRGGLSLVSYRPDKPGYVEGVRNMLMSRYFDVSVVKR